MDLFAKIAEDKIKEAIKKKEFENLPGIGQPLELKDDFSGMPEEVKMGYRMLKNTGYTPADVKEEILRLEELLNEAEEKEQIRKLQGKLTKKRMELEKLLEKKWYQLKFPLWVVCI